VFLAHVTTVSVLSAVNSMSLMERMTAKSMTRQNYVLNPLWHLENTVLMFLSAVSIAVLRVQVQIP